MDRCISCQNILPRTVDRCPVCGHDNEPDEAETIDVPDVPQGRDFLEAMESRRTSTTQSARISSPRSGRAPKRTGHDGAVPLYETSTSTTARQSDFDLPELDDKTRSVAAFSARLNSNIKLGRKQSHRALVAAAVLVAAAALGTGTAIGIQRTDVPAQIAMSSLVVPVRPTDDPLVVEGPVEGFDPAAIVGITETPECGAPINTFGAVVEGGTIVAPLFSTQNGDTPAIRGDGFNTDSDIIGLSNPDDLTILRPADRIEQRLLLATATQIRVGTPLAVVSASSSRVTLRPAVVTDFETRDGIVHSFSISTTFSDAAGETFARGTLVVDDAGNLVGIADNAGSFVTAQRISETVAQFQADPTFPQPVCS
ncbi:MAG: hypothetical protein KJN63_04275 [Acidimicrobiia bacterium]|nr:hypothetical protein [Acidimicrobiia bacterium]